MLSLVCYDIYLAMFVFYLSRLTFYYVTPSLAAYFHFDLESISYPFSVPTLVGDSVVAKKVYRDCVVSIGDRETLVDLIELDMVDFI